MATRPEKSVSSNLTELILGSHSELIDDWIREMSREVSRGDLMKAGELRSQCERFLQVFAQAIDTGSESATSNVWDPARELLRELSASRAKQGFTPSETASFVFSLKRPLFDRIQAEFKSDAQAVARALWAVTEILDSLGLYTSEVYLKTRQDVIVRQQEEMLELSTPVVKLWERIVAVPLIGTLDSARTQVVMENLLESIVKTDSKIAIIDITGVPTVDTVVAQHLLKTITAARLMGADCILSGIRPQIAQTIVHLGIDLQNITTKATLADAFFLAMDRIGTTIKRTDKARPTESRRQIEGL
jgi:rsbT co-antagonist protein RsbR